MESKNLKFDLQLFGGGGEGEPEMVEVSDPVTGQKVQIPKDAEALIGHQLSNERKIAREKIKEEYKPVIEKVEKLEKESGVKNEELEKLKEMQMTEDEKRTKNDRERINQITDLTKDRDFWKRQYEEMKKMIDIHESFGDAELFNPGQIAILFSNEGKARIEEIKDSQGKATGEFKTFVKISVPDEKGNMIEMEGTPKDLFPKWINLPQNLHHQKNTLVPGGGTRTPGGPKPPVGELEKQLEEAQKKGDLTQVVKLKRMIAEKNAESN